MTKREEIAALLKSWIGLNDCDGTHKKIVDIYNSQNPIPNGVKMLYTWPWCACTFSAAAIKLGYASYIPVEISCPRMVEKAKTMGIWEERDDYVPKVGDGILYDWGDTGVGDNQGVPDHVGTVVSVSGSKFTVIEGNMTRSGYGYVGERTLDVNAKYIRGFVTPRYDDESTSTQASSSTSDESTSVQPFSTSDEESLMKVAKDVILGKYGGSPKREELIREAGFDYNAVQSLVNKLMAEIVEDSIVVMTTDSAVCRGGVEVSARYYDASRAGKYKVTANPSLHVRSKPTTDSNSLGLIQNGEIVKTYGYYSGGQDADWYYVWVNSDLEGFCRSDYLNKVGDL